MKDEEPSDLLDTPTSLGATQLEFLRVEYEQLLASLESNEKVGERGTNLLLGATGAVSAGIGFAGEALASMVYGVAAFAAASLLGLGLLALRRTMQRNLVTTEYLNGLRRIRAVYATQAPALVAALPFPPSPKPIPRTHTSYGIQSGGYLETIAFTNCIFVAVFVGAVTVTLKWGWILSGGVAIAVAAAAWFAQIRWTRRIYASKTKDHRERRQKTLAWWHRQDPGETFRCGVGLIVERADGQVLAFERKEPRGSWQLPQGGLQLGESWADAAWRELREETGLDSEHVELIDETSPYVGYELPEAMRRAKTGRGQVHRWFLFRLRPDTKLPPLPSAEFADRAWLTWSTLIQRSVDFRKPVYEHLPSLLGDQLR